MSSKKTAAVLVLVVLISGGSGAWISHRFFPCGSLPPRDDQVTWQEGEKPVAYRLDRLKKERRRLEAALTKATSRIDALEARLATEDAGKGVRSDAATLVEGEKEEADGMAGPGGVDWKKLHQLFKENAELIAKVCEIEKETSIDDHLSPDELAALHETQAEWVKAASQARVASKYPLLDTEVLPELLKASLGGLLNLSEDQLETIAKESMGEPLSGEALESATPLEAHAERLDLVDRLEATLPEVLNDAQYETWQSVEERMVSLFRGEPKFTRLGFGGDRKNSINLVTRAWKKHYGFPRSKQGVLVDIAGDYLESARGVFQRHGDPKGALRNLARPVRENIETDLLKLQLATERRLCEHLAPEQLAKLVGKTPWLVQFELSTAVTMRTAERTGF